MWSAPKAGNEYRVNVHFVDDSYWDDGNRSTHRSHDYPNLVEAVRASRDFLAEGYYTATSGVTGKKVTKSIDEDDVLLWRWVDGNWRKVTGLSAIDLLALLEH